MAAGTKQRWFLFKPPSKRQKLFAPPLIREVRHHIVCKPQRPLYRQRPFIAESTLLHLGLQFSWVMKEGGREILRVVRRIPMLSICQVTLHDLGEGGIVKQPLA